ncbi:MAG: putative sporulation protein YtxC [Bacillota bacterium]|nr:putative sporulation protein YtxC [Bacillota bacterium]
MAEIIFQSNGDAKKFFQLLLKYLDLDSDNQVILLDEDRHIVRVIDSETSICYLDQVKEAFYEFIIKVKRDDWFREILKEHYYYEDDEEQQQILDVIYSILEGEREDLFALLKKTNEEPRIKEAINQVFQENISLSFDSFAKFRLKSYFSVLEGYVEISIDEYIMEQEYQMFVQTLRDFLLNRQPRMDLLHLLVDEEITFYTEEWEEVKRGELVKMIDRKLLFNHPIYVDSVSIAPLLSIAPNTILLYTKNPEEPLVRTIKNIFEERVEIHSFQTFCKKIGWDINKIVSDNGA